VEEKISWKVKDYKVPEPTTAWKTAVVLTAILFLIYAIIIAKSITFALLIIAIASTILVMAHNEPREIDFTIQKNGIKIDDKLYRYNEFKSFWVLYEPPEVKELILKSKRLLLPNIYIPLEKKNPVKIRNYLKQYLPEKEEHSSAAEAIARFFGL